MPHQQNPAPTDRGYAPAPQPAPSPRPSGERGHGQGQSNPRSHHMRNPTAEQRAPRVSRVHTYPGTRIVVPPAWARCTTLPNAYYWRNRDLMAEIQWISRSGLIPVTDVGDTVEALTDYALLPAGWRAYGISVPVGGTVQVEVQHPSLAWFRLMLVDKWGRPGPGMLQASIAHQPVLVTYKNPGKEALAIYIVVDDPAWWSDAKNPYTLLIRRDWDVARTDLSMVKKVVGLWGASPSVSAEFQGRGLTGPAVYPR